MVATAAVVVVVVVTNDDDDDVDKFELQIGKATFLCLN